MGKGAFSETAMKKKLGVLLLVACVAVPIWWLLTQNRARAAKTAENGRSKPAVPVLLAPVTVKSMPVELRAFGTVEALTCVTVRAQITGTLAEVAFAEGAEIRAGDLLFRIDPRPFQAALDQAEAAQARTRAQVENAARDARRMTELFSKSFVSESDRDQAATTLAALQATERADAAAVESARIQLDFCTIRSPIAGRAGRRLADAGNLVTANSTTLVTINQLQPAAISFAIPQQEMFRVRGRTDARDLPVAALLPEDPAHPETGLLVFMDNTVDRTTGTITLKAEFPNASQRLWPGQYVTVRMVVAEETNAVVIPFRAVQNGQNGTYVYVVQPDGTVTNRLVKITRLVEEESVIGDGLQPGETVVTDGQQRLGPGSAVKNVAEPRAETAPADGTRRTGSQKAARP